MVRGGTGEAERDRSKPITPTDGSTVHQTVTLRDGESVEISLSRETLAALAGSHGHGLVAVATVMVHRATVATVASDAHVETRRLRRGPPIRR